MWAKHFRIILCYAVHITVCSNIFIMTVHAMHTYTITCNNF